MLHHEYDIYVTSNFNFIVMIFRKDWQESQETSWDLLWRSTLKIEKGNNIIISSFTPHLRYIVFPNICRCLNFMEPRLPSLQNARIMSLSPPGSIDIFVKNFEIERVSKVFFETVKNNEIFFVAIITFYAKTTFFLQLLFILKI